MSNLSDFIGKTYKIGKPRGDGKITIKDEHDFLIATFEPQAEAAIDALVILLRASGLNIQVNQ